MSTNTGESDTERGRAANGAPGYRIALILLGIIITPVVLSAPPVGDGPALSQTISAILVGSAILLVLTALTLAIGEHARQVTYDIVRFPFGRQGAKAITVLLAVSVFGWTAVTANGFGTAVQSLLLNLSGATVPLPVLVVLGCVIFVAATAFGFDILSRVAQFAVPVIAALLGYLVYVALSSDLHFGQSDEAMHWGVAVSSVVGTAIVLVVTAADFGSFARSRRHAVLGAVLAFAIAYPLLFIAGVIPSALTGNNTIIDAMAVIASALPAIILLAFAAVTANAGNMFQGTLAVSSLITAVKRWKITTGLGVAAAIVGSLNVSAWLPSFLLFLGIAAPPVAGIYIADFFLYRRRGYDSAALAYEPAVKLPTFAVWIAGCAVGYLTAYGAFTLTHIPSVNSLLVSALLYAAVSRMRVGRDRRSPNRRGALSPDTPGEGTSA